MLRTLTLEKSIVLKTISEVGVVVVQISLGSGFCMKRSPTFCSKHWNSGIIDSSNRFWFNCSDLSLEKTLSGKFDDMKALILLTKEHSLTKDFFGI